MNDMVRFESLIRSNVIFQRKVSSVPLFYLHFCATHRSNMQKSTPILYQYLGTKVCLHSYNDTVSANTEVIIRRYYLSFRLWRGSTNSKLCILFTVRYTSLLPGIPCPRRRFHTSRFPSRYTCAEPRYSPFPRSASLPLYMHAPAFLRPLRPSPLLQSRSFCPCAPR